MYLLSKEGLRGVTAVRDVGAGGGPGEGGDSNKGGEPKMPVCLKSASKKCGKARPYNTPKNLILKQVERAMERKLAAEEKVEHQNKFQPVDKKVL
jgi:hypothetical protein